MSYFPRWGPEVWSYTKKFYEGDWNPPYNFRPEVAKRAFDNTKGRFSNIYIAASNPAVLNDIKIIQDNARKQEEAFLAKYFPGRLTQNVDWKEIVRAFNELLSTKDTFENILYMIKQGNNTYKDGGTYYKDFVANLSGRIEASARRSLSHIDANKLLNYTSQQISDLCGRILVNAINQELDQTTYYVDGKKVGKAAYEAADSQNKKMIQPYKELKDKLGILKTRHPFINELIKQFDLETSVNQAIQNMNNPNYNSSNGRGRKKSPFQLGDANTFVNGKLRGSVFETVEGMVTNIVYEGLSNSPVISVLSGDQGIKADTIHSTLFSAGAQVDISDLKDTTHVLKNEDSLRANVIKHYEDFFSKMKNAEGEILFISDKSYTINENFRNRGFEAQGGITLSNLNALLTAVKSPLDIDELINYLANTGEDMIHGKADPYVLQSIATQIGYFLFDNLSIRGDYNFTAVNLFNLGGVYFPLSAYMELVYKALTRTAQDAKRLESLVSVTMSYGGDSPENPWTMEAFEHFRQGRIDKTKINVRFMKNFQDLVNELLPQ